MRILVVEDDADLGESLVDLLRSLGHDARLARNAPTALRLLAPFEPEVLVVDILLPVFDGNLVAEEVARRKPVGAPKVYAMTSRPELARTSSFDGVFKKPFAVNDLLAALGCS